MEDGVVFLQQPIKKSPKYTDNLIVVMELSHYVIKMSL